MAGKTTVSIQGDRFLINGRPTYEGRTCGDLRIEGLLLNSRMVQATFDDRNPETRSMWDYPDGPWDAERNVQSFLDMLPVYRDHGMLAFTVNMQGGSPEGYSPHQPWHNSAFEADGSIRDDYRRRFEQIFERADELGMVVILGLFYFGQDERLADESAVIAAVDSATDWLTAGGWTNVLVEIDNEANVPKYEHTILTAGRVHELVHRVKERSEGKLDTPAGRLLVSCSMGGGGIPPEALIDASDFILLHGNGQGHPDKIRKMVDTVRASESYRGQPIVFNEDDHFDFDQADNNFLAAVSRYASWGYFDYRMKDEGFDEGYQSVPTNWGISSGRKRGFFGLMKKLSGV